MPHITLNMSFWKYFRKLLIFVLFLDILIILVGFVMIERKEYMDRLIGYRDKQVIKIITGIRRCGKSTLLALFQHMTED